MRMAAPPRQMYSPGPMASARTSTRSFMNTTLRRGYDIAADMGVAVFGQDGVGQRGPRRFGPRTEGCTGEADAGHVGNRIDPDEPAGSTEMSKRRRRVGGARPMGRLGVTHLGTETPV